ncbi:MAG: DNA polymerase III subunit delta' [Chakrabartia sp.]
MSLILGQEKAITAFRAAMQSGRLHHAWLLTGPEGVGKFTTALQCARRLLAEGAGLSPDTPGLDVPFSNPVARLLEAGSHPDFVRIERLPSDDKLAAKPPVDWPADAERARSIKVGQIRDLNGLFATKPSLSARRVVVIDDADALEISAANALLKRLEEPPPGTIFLLVAQSAGRLLPTIRSRCRVLRFDPLSPAQLQAVLQAHLPDAASAELAALVQIGAGSPGRALRFAGLDMAALDSVLDRLLREGDAGSGLRLALAAQLSGKAAQPRYEAFLQRVPAFLAEAARQRQGDALGQALIQWENARKLAGQAISTSLDVQNTVFSLASMVAALAPGGTSAKA